MTKYDKENVQLYKSYIGFSERCSLKDIRITSSNVTVIKRNDLIQTINWHLKTLVDILTVEEVQQIYNEYKKYMLVDDMTKKEHVRRSAVNYLVVNRFIKFV